MKALRRYRALFAFAVCGFAFPAAAATQIVDGVRWSYTIMNDWCGYSGAFLDGGIGWGSPAIPTNTRGAVSIPSRLGGRNVVGLMESCFGDCSQVTSLSIPATVRYIDVYAFTEWQSCGCLSLQSFLVDADNPAFRSVDGVLYTKDGRTLVAFPPGRTGSFSVPEGTTELKSCSFRDTRLHSLSLPQGLVSIGGYAFTDSENLETITVPESVASISWLAFCLAGSLKTVYLPRRFEGTTGDWSVPDGCRLVFYDHGTVFFEPEGGYVYPRSKSVVVGAAMGSLPIPSRDGYRFEGWWTLPGAGGSLCVAGTRASSVSTTLYARWKEAPAGIRQPIYRFYSKKYKGHFFTIDPDERATLMCTNPNWGYEGVAYEAFTEQARGTTALHRFYSKKYKGHFFTIDEEEMWTVRNTNPNWNYEGVAYYVYPEAVEGSVPVYRFWSKGYRHHFYTVDEDEMWTLRTTNPNWAYEGVAFYALPNDEADAAVAFNAERTIRNGSMDDGSTNDGKEWSLAAADGTAVAVPGVTEIGGTLVETRGEMPEAAEIESRAEGAESESHAESAEFAESSFCAERPEAIPLHLALPAGVWRVTLWSAADGVVAEEPAEGAFDFELPADGAWHWLRVRDGEGEDACSLWLRAE